jgi:uncharacterized protein (TIGR03437 family)
MRLSTPAISLLLTLGAANALGQAPPPYVLRTIAGSANIGDGGPATAAIFANPVAVVSDQSGNTYVLDQDHRRIRRIATDGSITTFVSGVIGFDLALDRGGDLLVAGGDRIIRVAVTDGKQSVVAGRGGRFSDGDGLTALEAGIAPTRLLAGPDGSIYFTEIDPFHTVRKIDPNGIVTTLAGRSRTRGYVDNVPAADARLNSPWEMALDRAGNLYVADILNCRIRRISTADGRMTTFAGNGNCGRPVHQSQAAGSPVSTVGSLAFDSRGVLYFASRTLGPVATVGTDGIIRVVGDPLNRAHIHVDSQDRVTAIDHDLRRLLRLEATGRYTGLAGSAPAIGDGGPASSAVVEAPVGITVRPDGTIYIAEGLENSLRIRRMNSGGTISTLVKVPGLLDVLTFGGGSLFASQSDRVLRVSDSGSTTTVAGGIGVLREGGPATGGSLAVIGGLAIDTNGRLLVSQRGVGNKVWVVESSGIIRTVAGKSAAGFGGDGGLAVDASLNLPVGMCLNTQGELLISDTLNHRIRKVARDGKIETWLGNGTNVYAAAGAPVRATTPVAVPQAIVCGRDGNVFFVSGQRVYQATPDGRVYPVAYGSALPDPYQPLPENVSPLLLSLEGANALALDPSGRLLLANSRLNRVFRLEPNPPASLVAEGGAARRGRTGSALAEPLAVRVIGQLGEPTGGIPVAFTVTSGEATPRERIVPTGADGIARAALTLGAEPGEVLVSASVQGVASPVVFTIAALGPGVNGNLPEVTAAPEVSTNARVTISGRHFAEDGTDLSASLVEGRLPTELAGVCVEFDGVPAPIVGVKPGEVSVVVPAVVGNETSIRVTTGCRSAMPARSATLYRTRIREATPLWEFAEPAVDDSGRRKIRLTGEGDTPATAVTAGGTFGFWATGLGLTEPKVIPGEVAQEAGKLLLPITMTIGGREVPVDDVYYAGPAPGRVAQYVILLRVPDGLPAGEHPVVLKVGEVSTPAGGVVEVSN